MSALTSLLARDQVVAVRTIEAALERQVMNGGDITSALLEQDALSENTLAAYAAALHARLPATREEVMGTPREVVRLVPRDLAEAHRLVPIGFDGTTLTCAVAAPLSRAAEAQLAATLGHPIECRIVCEVRIAAALSHLFGIEPTPRMRRLIERLRERDAGPLLYVAPPEPVTTPSGRPSARSSAASFLDDDEEDEAPPSAPSALPPAAEEARPQVPTQPPPRPVSVPPPASARPPAAIQPAVAAPQPPAPAPRAPSEPAPSKPAAPAPSGAPPASFGEPSAAAALTARRPEALPSDPPARAARRLRGPLTAAQAAAHLDDAKTRDDVIETLFAFARQFFDAAALFTVQDEHAELREAHGQGGSASGVGRSPILLGSVTAPRGLLGEARARLVPVVRTLGQRPDDADLVAALGQPPSSTAIAVPIAIRARTVLLVVGVRVDEAFHVTDVPELVAFVPRVVGAIERLIRRKKIGGRRETAAAVTTAPVTTAAVTAPAEDVPAAAGEASPPLSKPSGVPAGRRSQPRTLLGIPRSAPPPPSPEFEVPRVELPPRTPAELADWAPSGVPSRQRATLPAPRVADEDEEPVVTITAPPHDDDDAPELFFSTDAGDDDAGLADEAGLADDPLDDGRSTVPSPPPALAPAPIPTMSSAPPPGLAAPRLVSAAYSVNNVAEETVVPRRRTRTRSDRPSSIAAARGEHGDVAPTDDGPSQRAEPAPSHRSRSRSHSSPPPRASSTAHVRADEPSIIVDMGGDVDDLLGELLRAAQDEEGVLVAALLRLGDAALPMLTQAFPGPLWFDRHASGRRPPRGRDASAVARALHAFGSRAAPYVASLLGAAQPERRFCALLLAGDMVVPNLLDAALARLLDDDERVRQLASEIAPRFRGLAGWDEQMTLLRRAARIAGKDPARRVRAVNALGSLGDAGALETLVRLLEDDSPEIVRAAHAALVVLCAEDLGTSARKWTAWSTEHGTRHRIEWLIDALTHAEETIRTRAGDELKQLTQQYFGFHPGTTRREREVAQEKYRRWWQAEGRQQFS